MKAVAFNGSARKDGNSAMLLNAVLEELKREGIGTELIQLSGKSLQGRRFHQEPRGKHEGSWLLLFHQPNRRASKLNEFIEKSAEEVPDFRARKTRSFQGCR